MVPERAEAMLQGKCRMFLNPTWLMMKACPERDLNPYDQRSKDFKSFVSTDFTIWAWGYYRTEWGVSEASEMLHHTLGGPDSRGPRSCYAAACSRAIAREVDAVRDLEMLILVLRLVSVELYLRIIHDR